jgi:hypothetical protein
LFSEGPLNAALVAAAIRDFLAGNRRLRVNHAGCATREQPVITGAETSRFSYLGARRRGFSKARCT